MRKPWRPSPRESGPRYDPRTRRPEHQKGPVAAFEAAMKKARPLIEATEGFQKMEVRPCVESKDRYLLLVWWSTVEAHTVGFRQSRATPNGARRCTASTNRFRPCSTTVHRFRRKEDSDGMIYLPGRCSAHPWPCFLAGGRSRRCSTSFSTFCRSCSGSRSSCIPPASSCGRSRSFTPCWRSTMTAKSGGRGESSSAMREPRYGAKDERAFTPQWPFSQVMT